MFARAEVRRSPKNNDKYFCKDKRSCSKHQAKPIAIQKKELLA